MPMSATPEAQAPQRRARAGADACSTRRSAAGTAVAARSCARWVARRARARRAITRARRRRARRRARSTAIPRQGLRHQRAVLRLRRREPALAGDIVLCAPVVRREARAQGKALARPLRAPDRARRAAPAGLRPRARARRRAHGSARDAHPATTRVRRSLRARRRKWQQPDRDDPYRPKPGLLERLSRAAAARAGRPRAADRSCCTPPTSATCSTPTRCR